MRILTLAHAVRAGGGRATCTNILKALTQIDGDNTYCFLLPDQPEYRSLSLEGLGHEVIYFKRKFGHLGRWYFDNVSLKKIIARYRPDLIWGMGNLGLSNPPCPQVLSVQHPYLVYDVSRARRLSPIDRAALFLLRRTFRKSLARTSLVFCQTATMERRLASVLRYRGRTVVTSKEISSFAVAGDHATPPVLSPLQDKFKLLYVTRYYSHKGLEMIVDVMDSYRDELADTVAIITVSADQHPAAARLLKRIERRNLADRIVNVGPLVQKELAGYYRACNAVLMPTRLESFSGTYLEAMHFGVPILTSNLDFAQEVCGDAAIYFDPWDAEAIKDAIVRVKNDLPLQEALVAKGAQRLSEGFRHTWGDIARLIKANLEQVGQDSSTPVPVE